MDDTKTSITEQPKIHEKPLFDKWGDNWDFR